MRNTKVIKASVILALFSLLTAPVSKAQERRAMTLEDVMKFHHLSSPVVSHDGKWIAYAAAPDYGDGYGVLVSSDNKSELKFERAEAPRFSAKGDWVMFRQVPPHAETKGKSSTERPKNGTLLIKTSDGEKSIFDNIKRGRFSDVGSFLFIHKHSEEDSTLSDEQNETLKKAGTPLVVRNLESDSEIILPFVDSWTIDSLSTTLVYTINDTLEKNNGLWYLSLQDITSSPVVIDTTGKGRYNSFAWYEKESRLAYTRADDIEKDTIETAVLFSWNKNKTFPDPLLYQEDAPEGYFLPFDNRIEWSNNGEMLFFGFRPEEYSAKPEEYKSWGNTPDSIRQEADIDIWHGDDPVIKTHEKELWSRISRQNLLSVYHIDDRKFVQLADKDITDLDPPVSGDYALATTNIPHRKRITWEGWLRDAYVLNIYTGNKVLVAKELRDLTSLSPGGRHVLYFDDKHWFAYDIENRETRNLTADLDIPFYNETDDTPSPPSSYRIAGWMEDGESVLLYDRYDIWHVNLRTGSMRNITNGKGREWKTTFRIRKLNNNPLFKNSETLFLEGFNDETKVRSIYTARPDREGVNLAIDEGKNLRLRLLSDDERTIVFTRESYHEFPDLWVTNSRFRDPVRVSGLGEQTSPFNWGTAELVSFNSADGVPLQGVIIKPGDYDPSKKYPVFVYYYEKFSQRLNDFNQTVINHRPSFGYYASNGYVVFLPDIHFKEGRPGMSAVNSLVPAVKKIIETGIADPDAIGLHGHSWSGYQTAYVVTQTDIFRAAIAGAPVSNMTSAYGGIRWGSGLARQFQYETGQSRLGSSIFEKRYLYIENSPLFYAHEINTPMLIMHGDADEAVPWEQSIELYLAMRRAGKDIIFLQYRDEPHHPQKYPNKVDYTIRMKEYFDYHLRGYDPAEWIITGAPYKGN